ncbi:hypothetical protein SAMN04488511_103208 [Pedobacter suwonensis]|uniref:DoxX-like family protein n=1 Tax=Pedobacter suwonensis TaxID=332999 RepID=A0A1I0SU49_9SPHI|nr:hypothetical protein [Pedobacter suwonensis]SFA42943.1 hypothetical protein SAMN04488511_103208 [Pedobacter suwonensis]
MSENALQNAAPWNIYKKISFRFFFLLLSLFIILNNNGAFTLLSSILQLPNLVLHDFIPWFSKHIIHYHYDFTIYTNGSGDTSYDWILLLFIFLVSVIGSIIWSVLDRKRKSYHAAYYWLVVLVRFYLAFTLILYGAIKVIKLQFPDPSLMRLLQPFGDASPMGLAWTFLGFSKGYNIFMGIIEVSAVLLLFRRTVVIGAFLSLAATVHVMTMNYFFDVPVKLLSTALVVMCLFILAPHFLKLYRFFIKYESQQLEQMYRPEFKKKWLYYTAYGVKYLYIAASLLFLISSLIDQRKTYGSAAPKPFMYGIYNVEHMRYKGKILEPLTTDSTRWKQLIINYPGYARIKKMNDSTVNFTAVFDQGKKIVVLKSTDKDSAKYVLNYTITGKDKLTLSGLTEKDSISVSFKRKDLKDFKLINRGFHWISEYPYNR